MQRGLRIYVHTADRIALWLARLGTVIMDWVSRYPVVHTMTSVTSLVSFEPRPAVSIRHGRRFTSCWSWVGLTGYWAASTFSIAMPFRPAFSMTVPETLTFFSMYSINFAFGFL